MLKCLDELLSRDVYWKIENIRNLTEIRLRVGKNLVAYSYKKKYELDYIITYHDIQKVLDVASGQSMYAIENSLKYGFIPYKQGIRIGLVGEGVFDNGKFTSMKNISSISIRVPSMVGGISDRLYSIIDNFKSTLILSPPCSGKTTLLKNMVRSLSNKGVDVLVIDERNEISATTNGVSYIDLGNYTDIVVGVPKAMCYEGAVRTMSPKVIATDEIFGESEIACLEDVSRCGISFIATVHSGSIDKLLDNKPYDRLKNIVDNYILLSDNPIGSIVEVRSNCLHS